MGGDRPAKASEAPAAPQGAGQQRPLRGALCLPGQTGRAVRHQVADELEALGFGAQTWRSCFPSLGRPSAVVCDRAFELADAAEFLPKMVRDLVVVDPHNALMFDPRLTFRHLVGARAARSGVMLTAMSPAAWLERVVASSRVQAAIWIGMRCMDSSVG